MSQGSGARPRAEACEGRAVRMRLTSTQEGCTRAVQALGRVFEVARVSAWLPLRSDTTMGRVYAYVRPLSAGTDREEAQR
jgi:hypothetical protein